MSIDQFLLSADTTDLNYPEIRPTLDLNFARVKALDPRITFTRASGGSYVGADGLIKYAGVNEARFDHDPETGESLGLLIEEARTNLFTWSENPINAWNIRISSPIIENSIVAPDGTLTADSFIERTPSSGLGDHYLDRTTISQAANVPLSYSIYVKRLSGIRPINLVLFANSNSSTISATFNLDRITSTRFTSGTGSIVDSSITPLPNGWFRLSISGTPTTASVTDLRVRIQLINQSTTYIGDGTSGLYIWGAQLEVGAFPTSYIPTQASTRTRQTDIATITGKNFSDFYNPNEFTVVTTQRDFSSNSLNSKHFFSFTDGTAFNRIVIYNQSNTRNIRSFRNNLGVINDEIIRSGYVPGDILNISAAYKSNNSSIVINGASPLNLINKDMPSGINRLGFWRTFSPVDVINGHILNFKYYSKRLPNAQLQALTR